MTKRMNRPYSRAERAAMEPLPERLCGVVREILRDPQLNEGVEALMDREREMASPAGAMLAGIFLHGPSRDHWERRLDEMWARDSMKNFGAREPVEEAIIGGGLHAATYSAVRRERGFPQPLVLERQERVGGTFAISREASFYLNSRNRPGPLGVPGGSEALNVLPASVVQPSDIGGQEYQTNSEMAFVIRTNLAMHARVMTGKVVKGFSLDRFMGLPCWRIFMKDDSVVKAWRLLVATGLGDSKRIEKVASPRILDFPAFMARMDRKFPMKDMGRVAVIGAGDSGRTAVEALCGQGPSTRWSTASLDRTTEIRWFNCGSKNRLDWESCNRSRYKGIGRLLPKVDGDTQARVLPVLEKAFSVVPGYRCVYVNKVPFDTVINCTGFDAGTSLPLLGTFATQPYPVNNRRVAKVFPIGAGLKGGSGFIIGPAAGLELDDFDAPINPFNVKENLVAIYRNVERTATLANHLGGASMRDVMTGDV